MEKQIITAEDIMKLLKKLSYTERIKFYKTVKETGVPNGSLEEYLTEQRFSGNQLSLVLQL